MVNELEILEDLIDNDPFIRSYPSFASYRRGWDEMGGASAINVPDNVVFEFYAEKLRPEEALHIWLTYDPIEQLELCK